MNEIPDIEELRDPGETAEPMRFGNYVLLRHIGSGGMAEIDLARVEGPNGVEKLVVIKRIRPEFADTEIYVGMFLDEARIASTLQHPNIIQVHDVGQIGEQSFIAMEYLRGKTLSEILVTATEENRHLPIDFSVGVICCVCAGLHHAHQMTTWEGDPLNIVHRDVSPDNIFVTHEGHVKLVDFGLAKAKNRSTHTRVGVIKGTVGYLAPEHFESTEADRRLDVFSSGVLLWELITGHRLFAASTASEARDELHDKQVPSPSKYRPECSVPLEAIIRRALHKDPTQRYQSAEAFLLDLERMAESQRMWLSPRRRSDVMEALFPGRRDRPLRDATMVHRRPTPLQLPSRKPATGWRRWLEAATGWLRQNPDAALLMIGALLFLSLVLGIATAVRDDEGTVARAAAAPAVRTPAKVDSRSPAPAPKRPRGKKQARRKRGR